jgi:short-subunit dehydrogenase
VSYVIVGGTAGIGRSIAEQLARQGADLLIVSRDARDAEAQAADLACRYAVRARAVAIDLADRDPNWADLEACLQDMPKLEGLILAAGFVGERDNVGTAGPDAERIVRANFLGPLLLVEQLLPRLAATGDAVLVALGSVAACRGRRRNAAYAAAKRALQSYFESVRHATAGQGVRVQFYRLGYVDTNLAFGKATPLRPVSPEHVARRIVVGLGSRQGDFYEPRFWGVVCAILRWVPWPLYRRLQF